MNKKLVAFACLAAAPLAAPSLADAGSGGLSLSPSTITVGSSFQAIYSGCNEGDEVDFSIDGIGAGSATCQADGTATNNMMSPFDPAEYEVEANGATAILTVQRAALPELDGLVLSPSTVEVNGSFQALFRGCGAGTTVQFTIDGTPAGSARCGNGGEVAASLTAPNEPGQYQVATNGFTSTLTVQQAPLPDTGPDSALTIALAGGAVLAAGIGATSVARIRRHSP